MKPTVTVSPLDEKMRFRVEIKHAVAIGPGKADVLQGVAEAGSIAEAGRRLGMSYQRAWTLVNAMSQDFVEPLVSTIAVARPGAAQRSRRWASVRCRSSAASGRWCRSSPRSWPRRAGASPGT